MTTAINSVGKRNNM